MKPAFTRKEFLVSTCKAGCGLLAGISLLGSLESCASVQVFKTQAEQGRIRVPLSEFAAGNMRVVRAGNLDYDIMVVKKADGHYNALYMRCTHQDWQLTANAKGLNCSLHGSAFDLEGNVTAGPATEPLKKLHVEQTETHLIIS